jgi:ABC-type multidrug transport system fused ATPase/permease subunit
MVRRGIVAGFRGNGIIRSGRVHDRERSRLYIARALLQGATVLILDESFAALDPATLSRVQQCVLAHAPALMVIAHP